MIPVLTRLAESVRRGEGPSSFGYLGRCWSEQVQSVQAHGVAAL
jgi:hypothetical protein